MHALSLDQRCKTVLWRAHRRAIAKSFLPERANHPAYEVAGRTRPLELLTIASGSLIPRPARKPSEIDRRLDCLSWRIAESTLPELVDGQRRGMPVETSFRGRQFHPEQAILRAVLKEASYDPGILAVSSDVYHHR